MVEQVGQTGQAGLFSGGNALRTARPRPAGPPASPRSPDAPTSAVSATATSHPAHSVSAAASTERPLFLGVTRSARGLRWYDRLGPGGVAQATAIAQRHHLPEVMGRLLAARGIGLDDVPRVLTPRLRDWMTDPSAITQMDSGAARLADAVRRREPVAIFGDYDVDGACSSALLARFLEAHGVPARIYIPDRLFEGYGPNPDAIATLIDEGAKLIVTVDCGTASHAPLQVAKDRGIDVVVIDHHQADEDLPPAAAIINPNRQDDLSGLGHLCAAGVVFMTLVATARVLRDAGHTHTGYTQTGQKAGAAGSGPHAPDLMGWLDLVALATVCDVVPLVGLNRAFVTQGLAVMHQRRNPGLRALCDVAGLASAPTPYHLGYVLGPRINAGGRIGRSSLGAELLSMNEAGAAEALAQQLDQLNRERKAMETRILEEARAAAEAIVAADPDVPVICVAGDDWHKGLVGLVSSRLTDQFGRPSCVLAWAADGTGTGSLRSIAGVDIGAMVRAAAREGILVKGGGHAMAAGLTVERARLADLQAHFAAHASTSVVSARATAGMGIDGAMTPAGASLEFMRQVEQAGPYGVGNPTPRFVFPSHQVRGAKVVGEAHIRASIVAGDGARINAIAFRAVGTPLGDALLGQDGRPLHVAGTLKRDSWGGREKVDMTIDDVADPAKCA